MGLEGKEEKRGNRPNRFFLLHFCIVFGQLLKRIRLFFLHFLLFISLEAAGSCHEKKNQFTEIFKALFVQIIRNICLVIHAF